MECSVPFSWVLAVMECHVQCSSVGLRRVRLRRFSRGSVRYDELR